MKHWNLLAVLWWTGRGVSTTALSSFGATATERWERFLRSEVGKEVFIWFLNFCNPSLPVPRRRLPPFFYFFKQPGETVLFHLVRALALGNANATLFYHSKNLLYHYTILFYNTSTFQNSISIKILFFNISLLFLYNCHFF